MRTGATSEKQKWAVVVLRGLIRTGSPQGLTLTLARCRLPKWLRTTNWATIWTNRGECSLSMLWLRKVCFLSMRRLRVSVRTAGA